MIRFLSAAFLFVATSYVAHANPPFIFAPAVQPYAVPAYGIQYPDPTELAAELKLLREEIKQLRASLVAGNAAVTSQPQVLKTESIVKQNCAACHTGDAKAGAGHVFDFDALSSETKKAFTKEVIEGRMPKKRVLSAKEKIDLISSLFDPKEEKK